MNFSIVGAGLQGIYACLRLRKIYPDADIHLLEYGDKIGGLYNSFNIPVAGEFDKGMHIYYETLNSEIDSIFFSALPSTEWITLEGNRKDIAGVFHNNHLSTSTPYINLGQLTRAQLIQCMGEFMESFDTCLRSNEDYTSSYDYFKDRFGKSIADLVIEPVIKKLWKTSAVNMHPASTRLVLMDRICHFSEKSMQDLIKSARLREVLAYPEQLNLDLSKRTSQRGLYPKTFGLGSLVQGLQTLLNKSNIKVHLNTKVSSITHSNGKISSISCMGSLKQPFQIEDIERLVWCAPVGSLGRALGVQLTHKDEFDRPLAQKYVYFLIDEYPCMRDIYYYYSLQPNTSTFRVTNYAAYCPNAARLIQPLSPKKLYPICVEMHYTEEHQNNDDKLVISTAVQELIEARVINSQSTIRYSKVVSVPSGFPLLTIKNCNLFSSDRDAIGNLDLSNLVLSGQVPEKGVFFLHETLLNLHSALN